MMNAMFEAWSQLAFPGLQAAGRHARTRQAAPVATKFMSGFFQHGLRSLRYKLFVPSRRAAPMPLLLMLHGCGQDADGFAQDTGMNELAEAYGFLVLYPEQSCDANWSRCWNWHHQTHHQRGEGEPALLAALTGKILAEHAGAGGRACVAGLSSGGAMAVILGRTYPELFAAVGCHSGMAHGSATDGYGALLAMQQGVELAALAPTTAASPVPVIVFHGDEDATVHHKNGIAVVEQSLAAHAALPAGDARAFARSDERGEMRGRSFTRTIHRCGAGKLLAEQWTVHGMGHAWSGGAGHGAYADVHGPEAGREMLRFFTEVLAA